MSDLNTAMPAVRLTVASIEGNTGEYLSLEFLRTVNGVFDEMLSRLYHGAVKRDGWATAEPWRELTEHECRTCIRDSIAKGKLIDAMNYLMFAHLNGHKLVSLRNPSTESATVSIDSQMRDQLAKAMGVTGRSWDEMLAMVGAVKAQAVEHDKTIEAVAKELKLDPYSPADTIISTVHFLVKRCQSAVTEISITGCTDPDVLENAAKLIRVNSQRLAFAWDGRTKNTVTIKNEAAPDLFPEQRIQIKAGAKWPHMTPPAGADEELKWPRTTPPEGEDKTRKTALPNAMAAPYGVKASKKQPQYELTMDVDNSGIASPLFIFRSEKDRDDYLPLLRTFLGALEQAAYGKGRERHANDLPFTEQPILTMARMLDNDAGLAQQVIKKTVEARSLPSKTARINELRGTLVYAAAMILFEERFSNKCEPFEEFGI
ncbi:hypothetical protein L6P55_23670 [Klebsiella pneumoniae]|nr:hypothetical protein [Klebsiella pneumoniae]